MTRLVDDEKKKSGRSVKMFCDCRDTSSKSKILYIKWNLVVRGSWFVVRGRRFLCTYSTTVQKLFENSFRRFRSRSLQRISSKMPRRRTLLRLTAKETAHVNARSLQSFLWVIVNEFMSSIVCTNAEGRLLESTEERRRRN